MKKFMPRMVHCFDKKFEVSSYLHAYFGLKDAHRPVSRRTNDLFKHAIVAYKDDSQSHEFVSSSSEAIQYLPKEHAQDISLLGIDNLAEEENGRQRNDDLAAFEEMTYEGVETLKYDFVTAQDPLTDVPVNLPDSSDMDQQYVSPVQFGSDDMTLDVVARRQLTTVCVWRGVELNHDGMDSELQSDSVGFMCPTCKAKISGQLNLLDGFLFEL